MNIQDIEQYADDSRQMIRLDREYDEINLHGTQGIFRRVKRSKKEAEVTDEGKTLQGVILRVRRQLVQFNKNSDNLWTPEHFTKEDPVFLFEGKVVKDQGIAGELREKYPKLRTQQVLYVLLENGEVVRLIVKGASLGSDAKPENSIPFYEYLSQSFNRSIGEHVWKFKTSFTPVTEKGPLGSYFAISFEKGEKLEIDFIENTIGPWIKKLFEQFKIADRKPKLDISTEDSQKHPTDQSQDTNEEIPVINLDEPLPSDDINPKDLPF